MLRVWIQRLAQVQQGPILSNGVISAGGSDNGPQISSEDVE